MTDKEIIKQVSQKTGVDEKVVELVMQSVSKTKQEGLIEGTLFITDKGKVVDKILAVTKQITYETDYEYVTIKGSEQYPRHRDKYWKFAYA